MSKETRPDQFPKPTTVPAPQSTRKSAGRERGTPTAGRQNKVDYDDVVQQSFPASDPPPPKG